jgi:branched-chain amino acid transport system substrate-binding protein
MMCRSIVLSAFVSALFAHTAFAQSEVEIGMVTTLSGPAGYLGADVRDGFQLAVDEESGKLGGVPVRVLVEDDGLKPGQGKEIADRFLGSEKVKILTGFIFSNVLAAVAPDAFDAGAFVISPNAGPSNFAGKDCNKLYFVTSWQNDAVFEAAGQNATNLGKKRAYVLAPNYQAGKDAIAGFKRFFKGDIVGETYTRLDQTDFGPEMSQIRAANPDAVFQFHPGGLGITFIKQYVQAGLENIPMFVGGSGLDRRILTAIGPAAEGVNITSQWNSDFDNPASRAFVSAFKAKYNRIPDSYASQGYDTARLLASALKAVHGDLSDTEAFRQALLRADFVSVRGEFRFAHNQHPIEDLYALRVVKDADGKLDIKTVGKVLSNHTDAYGAACKL